MSLLRTIAATLLAVTIFAPLSLRADKRPPWVKVKGDGKASTLPDKAAFWVGVTTLGPTAADALRANTTEMNQTLHAIEKLGIPKKDVRTSNLWVSPTYSRPTKEGAKEQITGYKAPELDPR